MEEISCLNVSDQRIKKQKKKIFSRQMFMITPMPRTGCALFTAPLFVNSIYCSVWNSQGGKLFLRCCNLHIHNQTTVYISLIRRLSRCNARPNSKQTSSRCLCAVHTFTCYPRIHCLKTPALCINPSGVPRKLVNIIRIMGFPTLVSLALVSASSYL